MKNKSISIIYAVITFFFLSVSFTFAQNVDEPVLVAHFPMELNAQKNSVTELISGKNYAVTNNAVCENIPGAVGQALRFDGYSTYINAQINSNNLSDQAISTEIWVAMENYPMMNVDGASDEMTVIAGNRKIAEQSGFAFVLNAHGVYGFEVYINGQKQVCYSGAKLPRYEWVHLQAVVSIAKKTISLYNNGRLVRRISFEGNSISVGTKQLIIGKSYDDVWTGPFRLNTINGLIDDFKIYSGELAKQATALLIAENPADLSIPAIRFQDEIQRPVFHGMPGANWTNEPHGLVFYNNQYHLFFQKNGNGPYWGRIHWGHITSNDLVTWKEEKTAIIPENPFDIKGAWSGCIFTDNELTAGKPHIFYTAVDYSKASIAEASPLDEDLIEWQKSLIIPNRPNGLEDDFRDPYVFKSNGNYYLIVGSRKEGRGCATLHQYNTQAKTWSNDGRIFYQAAHRDYGEFWEMPVIVPMSEGKWLFAATPLGCKDGVQTLYWVGTINPDGTFNPFSSTPKEVELSNMSKDGFGLLSPSIMQKDGKNVAIGIVPDKLGSGDNYAIGWAHTFSLPREWTLDANNNLVQKPYSGLTAMRNNAESFSQTDFSLNGVQSLSPVNGKALEIESTFLVSSDAGQKFGFNLRKNGNNAIQLYYQPASNQLTLDARNVSRLSNDGWLYNGLYQSPLPQTFSAGQSVKLHIFLDHSILDIFINDTWAFSVRVFPTDVNSDGVEVFSERSTQVQSLKAWNFNQKNTTAISDITPTNQDIYLTGNRLCFKNISANAQVNIYNLQGQLLVKQNHTNNIFLPEKQLYIVQAKDNNQIITRKLMGL
ncbi:MAG: GH32 C-terminal domain-containing protein [Candidatus Symbiothrix sp.]|nr:GH32 C-terminal domain-containing protein [Candidatus Symbiothrix sp.]